MRQPVTGITATSTENGGDDGARTRDPRRDRKNVFEILALYVFVAGRLAESPGEQFLQLLQYVLQFFFAGTSTSLSINCTVCWPAKCSRSRDAHITGANTSERRRK